MNNIAATQPQNNLNTTCHSCSTNFPPLSFMITTPCKHIFHRQCFNKRIEKKPDECPICQSKFINDFRIEFITENAVAKKEQANVQSKQLIETPAKKAKKSCNNLHDAYLNRDFAYIKANLKKNEHRHYYVKHLDYCKKNIVEDIENWNKENIIGTINLLHHPKVDPDSVIKMLMDILNKETSSKKDEIVEIFACGYKTCSTRKYAIEYYMEQRNFDKLTNIIKAYKTLLTDHKFITKILLKDIQDNNLNNIDELLNVFTKAFTYKELSTTERYSDKPELEQKLSSIIDNQIKKSNSDISIDIVHLFLKYKLYTDETINYALNYSIASRDFEKINFILQNCYVRNFPLTEFLDAITEDIDKNQIDKIENFLKSITFIRNEETAKDLKEKLKILLNDLIVDPTNINIVNIFLNNDIKSKAALEFVLKYTIEAENFIAAKDLMQKNNTKLTPILEKVLQKNIDTNSPDNIDALLKLRNHSVHDIADIDAINRIITKILLKTNCNDNINLMYVFIKNNITTEKMLISSLKHYIEVKEDDKVNLTFDKCNSDQILSAFKEFLQDGKEEEISYVFNLIQNNKTKESAELKSLKDEMINIIRGQIAEAKNAPN